MARVCIKEVDARHEPVMDIRPSVINPRTPILVGIPDSWSIGRRILPPTAAIAVVVAKLSPKPSSSVCGLAGTAVLRIEECAFLPASNSRAGKELIAWSRGREPNAIGPNNLEILKVDVGA